MAKKPKRKKHVAKAARKVAKATKRVVKQSVKKVASRDASNIIKETRSVHAALNTLTRDVKRIGNLERNVAQMNKHFSQEIGQTNRHVSQQVSMLNKKLASTESKLSTNFNAKLSDLSTNVQKSMKAMSSSVHTKMAQQNEHFNDRLASLHSEMKIANGNASRRMDNIEEAILSMHEAVEALNDNWKEFTHSLMIEEKKR